MAIWKCKFCGAPLEVPESGSVAACEYCGIKQTVPKLDDERRNLLLDRAGQFLRCNEYDRAAALYEQAINEGGDDPELFWSLVLCRYGIEYVEDAATRRRIPTVNRTQFSAVSADPDYREAIARADASQREIYEREAAEIDAIQRGILEISQKEEPFDVFVCYKESDANGRRTPDSVLAQELYYGLKNEGFKVFFSRISLEDKLGTAYEPYIFSALHSAKVMVVIGTKPEYFNAVWVKNEWSRYLALIKQGEKKVLIPAYRDMDPYDLPDEFAALQAQDMGKLGFMQDLVRGIKKIAGRSAPKTERTPAAATPTVAAPVGAGSKENLLERGFLSLEYKEWETADSVFEQVLNLDMHEARAYIGKLLAERKIISIDALAGGTNPIDDDKNFEKAIRFANDEYREKLKGIADGIRQNINRVKYDQADQIPLDNLSLCYQAAYQFHSLGSYRDAAERAEHCERKIVELEDALRQSAEKGASGVGFIRLYSILTTFAAMLCGCLLSLSIDNALPVWLVFAAALLVGGIVVCKVYRVRKFWRVAVIPALFALMEALFYDISRLEKDYFVLIFIAIVCFAVHTIIIFHAVKNNSEHIFIDEGTKVLSPVKANAFSAVSIPASVTRIKQNAFQNCADLSIIYYKGTQKEWEAIVKENGWINGTNRFVVQCTNGRITYKKTN